MKADDVIGSLNARGIELWQDGGTLRYRAPAGALTEQERAALKANKPAILKALAPSPIGTTATTASAAVAGPTAVTAASIANRQAMPQIAAAVDQLRAVFGPVQVIFAAEGGRELGQAPDPGVIAHPPHVPGKPRKRGQL